MKRIDPKASELFISSLSFSLRQSRIFLIRILSCVAVGFTAACAAALFLSALALVTESREKHRIWIACLPWFGYVSAKIFDRYGGRAKDGFKLVLDEVHRPEVIVPLRMVPLILFSTLLSHLGGASVGREGTAVQMGASLADQWGRFWALNSKERRNLLIAGASAGFASAVGAPLAGLLFGLEVRHVGKLKWDAFFEAAVASWVGYASMDLLGFKHTVYPSVDPGLWLWKNVPSLVVLGLAAGLFSQVFVWATHSMENFGQRYFPDTKKRLVLIGFVLVFLYAIEGSYRFVGLGLEQIQFSFKQSVSLDQIIGKFIFTVISVGSGFKGGEFVPLVFMGSDLGNLFSASLRLPLAMAAALGFVACFGAAANTPLACTFMAMELFGWKLGPHALIVCYISYSISPSHGIYKGQRLLRPKHHFIKHFIGRLNRHLLKIRK